MSKRKKRIQLDSNTTSYTKKISVIIPVYNMENYIEDCINSLLNQTIKNIEIICVNDASTDNSLSKLYAYGSDERITIIDLPENSTANIARKKAVEVATGEYVLFVDADDTLEPQACEFLYNKMVETDVDILHFGTSIINCADLPEARINNMKKFVSPYLGRLNDDEVFKGCFENVKYRFSIWNKIYKMSLIKKAFEKVQNIPLPKAQDKYIYFIISYYAKSYLGISDIFYNYHFGHGVTGHNNIDLSTFKRYCTMSSTDKAIRDFLESENAFEKCKVAYNNSYNDMFNDCFANYFSLTEEQYGEGFDLMSEYFDKADVVSAFAKKFWWKQDTAVSYFSSSEIMTVKKDKIKTIATYYHKLECGGVQMVLVKLVEVWKRLGYKVVVLTDCEPCDGDYDLPDGVERIVIPSYFNINKENYSARAKALQKALYEYSVDLLVYHAWVSNILLWDLMICKMNNVKFMIHTHSIFSMPIINLRVFWSTIPYVYTMADGVITLSNSDKEYWDNFNDNVIKVVNPVRYNNIDEVTASSLSSHNIIWCQRLSNEKRPLDAIEIFNIVHKKVPTAKLFMLGKGTSSDIFNQIKRKIAEYQLEEDVILFGYQKDVKIFFELCSVFLMTSEYEGFSLSLLEGMSAGLPIVMYSLPYLTISESGKGIVSVPYKNYEKAANAVIELLLNDDYRIELGREARQQAVETLSYNYNTTWRDVLKTLEAITIYPHKINTMWRTLFSHYNYGVVKNNDYINTLKNKNKELEEKLNMYDEKLLLKIEDISTQLTVEKAKSQSLLKQKDETNLKHEKLKQELEKKKQEVKELNNKLKQKTDECTLVIKEKENSNYVISEIRKSFTYRLAMALTWFPRKIKSKKNIDKSI